jgi:hypothetical protein
MKRFLTIAVLLAATVLLAGPAFAVDEQARATARIQVNEGVVLFQAGQFAEAERNFLSAFEIAQVPTVALWAARSQERLGKWTLALVTYGRALAMQKNELWVGDAQQRAQTEAREELRRLEARVSKLHVVLDGELQPDLVVTMDGTVISVDALSAPVTLNPGEHVLEARQAGQVTRVVAQLREAEERRVTLLLTQPSRPKHGSDASVVVGPGSSLPLAASNHDVAATRQTQSGDPMRTFGWAGIGLGSAGVLVGSAAGLWLLGNRSSLHRDGCTGDVCVGERFSERVDRYNTLRTVSIVGFVVGGVGLAAGVTLLLTTPKSKTGSVGVTLATDRIVLRGEFQ